MLKFVELTGIDTRAEARAREQNAEITYLPPSVTSAPDMEADARFDNLDYDDLERPVVVTAEVPTFPIFIVLDHIREFYPRKRGAKGTRIVYANGAAQIVAETVEQVKAKFDSLNN